MRWCLRQMVIIATDDEIVFCDGFSGKVIDRIATEAEGTHEP